MLYRLLLILLLGLATPLARAAAPTTWPTSRPFPGVEYRQEQRDDPRLQLHVVTVDLARPEVKLRVVPGGPATQPGSRQWPTTLELTSAVARREGFDIAINADFFASKDRLNLLGREVAYFIGNPASPTGMAMTDGLLWADHPGRPGLVVRRSGAVSLEQLERPPPDAWQICGGGPVLVAGGQVQNVDAVTLAPRTAVGLDRAGGRLTLLVVDGRHPPHSVGLTMRQTADEMARLGCWTALNLDGGGSTTLVMRTPEDQWRILNRPSDGSDLAIPLSIERPVCNVLGITIGREQGGSDDQ